MGILRNIRTRSDLEYLAADLEEMRVNMYKSKNGYIVPKLIENEYEKSPNKSQFIEEVRGQILAARVLELTIPEALQEAELTMIALWVKENIGESIVLSLKVDANVVAGIKIGFNGKYANYSINDKLEAAIEKIKI
jgi:hypothetical protein